MSIAVDSSTPALRAAAPARIESIDVFRGLTIVAMIWVNDLGKVRDIPLWLKHVRADADAMTFPDVVFPTFLFIVGMSIPLAMGRRLSRGDAWMQVLWHIASRTLGLLAIGVLMVNMPTLNAAATGLSRPLWSLLAYVGAMLVWNAYPRSTGARRALFLGLRTLGVVLLIGLVVVYRGSDGERVTWLRTQWWGILGLIGWAYLVASCGYVLLRNRPAALVAAWAFCMALCIADHNGAIGRFAIGRAVNEYVSVGGHIGGHSAIVLAGVLAMLLLVPAPTVSGRASGSALPNGAGAAHPSGWHHIASLLSVAVLLCVAGAILRWPYGLSKNRVTPAWCLYCPAIACVSLAVLHWAIVWG